MSSQFNNLEASGHLQSEIRYIEGFDVLIFQGISRIDEDGDAFRDIHYNIWSKAAPGKMTVNKWIMSRFRKVLPRSTPQVLYPNGRIADGIDCLASIRDCYNRLRVFEWPKFYELYFKFVLMDRATSLQLKKELLDAGYMAGYIEEGFLFRDYFVIAKTPKIRVPYYQYLKIYSYIQSIAKKYTATVSECEEWSGMNLLESSK